MLYENFISWFWWKRACYCLEDWLRVNKVSKIFVAPGNGGTAIENKCENVNITDIDELVVFAKEQ